MESPSKAACVESHKEAHGLGACNVIEVSQENEFIPFMGEGGQNEKDLALTLSGEIDSGYRTIMLLDILVLKQPQASINSKITDTIKKYNGNTVKVPGETLMVSFIYAYDAVACSIVLNKYLETLKNEILYSIALATGKPVDEKGTDLFEETKKKAKVFARFGFQLGLCMDLDTKMSASRNNDFSKIDSNSIIVVDPSSYFEMKEIDELLQQNLNNSAFNLESLGKQLSLSKTQVYRKISTLFGVPPNRLLTELRLKYALSTLKQGGKTVSEVAYDSGFNSPTYFTRVFRNKFNVLPTEVTKSKFN